MKLMNLNIYWVQIIYVKHTYLQSISFPPYCKLVRKVGFSQVNYFGLKSVGGFTVVIQPVDDRAAIQALASLLLFSSLSKNTDSIYMFQTTAFKVFLCCSSSGKVLLLLNVNWISSSISQVLFLSYYFWETMPRLSWITEKFWF